MTGAVPLMDSLLEKGVLFLLIFTPLAFGTVQTWSVSLMEMVSFLLLALLLVKGLLAGQSPLSGRTGRLMAILLLLFAGVVLLQLLPLPPSLLGLLSPEALRIHSSLGNAAPGAWQTISITPHATLQELLLLLAYAAVFTVIVSHVRTRNQVSVIVTTILAMGGGS